jgi:glucose-6-phosphate dehydrogenase assembly protein OpcA
MLAGLWPEIAEIDELSVTGPPAEAALLAGWLRSRLGRAIALQQENADEVEQVVAGTTLCPSPHERPSPSDLLSEELDEFGRDPVYEAAARAASDGRS